MKRVLTVQDLSCLGKCSLTVALPVLSAMGCSCSVLPTAVLSTHTAFPRPHVRSLTGDIAPICDHWKRIGAGFDCISIGYLSDPSQADAIAAVTGTFDCPVVLDPVLGDQGKPYSGITPDHIAAVKALCVKATVILPNITEACLLTGMEYRQQGDETYYAQLLQALCKLCPRVVLTGVNLHSGMTGFMTHTGFLYQAPQLPGHYHGTGDLFAAVFTGAWITGAQLENAATQAAQMVERSIAATGEPTPFGLNFETQLHTLL